MAVSSVGEKNAELRVETRGQLDRHGLGDDVLGLVRVKYEDHFTDAQSADLWANLDDASDARVAILDRERKRAAQRWQIELHAVGYLAPKHEHLRAVADRGGDGLDADVGWRERRLGFGPQLNLTRPGEPGAGYDDQRTQCSKASR